ncbi:MAG: hypothetical protein JSV42_10700, partial [Chloroflexota bacterium]
AFFLTTIIAAYGVAAELTARNHSLRWLLPLTVLLLPGFVDILTSVNNDVGAVAFFSLFLWSGLRLIIRGFKWSRALLMLILALICFFTKNTVMLALFMVPIPLALSYIPNRRFVWAGISSLIVLTLFGVFTWGAPLNWYSQRDQRSVDRVYDAQTPIGKFVFKFDLSPGAPPSRVYQLIPSGSYPLDSETVTLGAWIWANKPVSVITPILHIGDTQIQKEVKVDVTPKFFTVTGQVDSSNPPTLITISPVLSSTDETVSVFYDGITVVPGSWGNDQPPAFSDTSGREGAWGGKQFQNLVRNPSAEYSGPRLRGWVETFIAQRYPANPILFLGLLLDPVPLENYYTTTIKSLLQTFWAKFGWGHVVIRGFHPYTILAVFTLMGIFGAAVSLVRTRKNIRWDIFLFLGFALLIVWGSAVLRGLPSVLDGSYFIPVARYAYPAIIPTMLILNIGWLEEISWIEKYIKIPKNVLLGILILCFVLLDMISIYSINQYYIQ